MGTECSVGIDVDVIMGVVVCEVVGEGVDGSVGGGDGEEVSAWLW